VRCDNARPNKPEVASVTNSVTVWSRLEEDDELPVTANDIQGPFDELRSLTTPLPRFQLIIALFGRP
jgi:hypothetical protein